MPLVPLMATLNSLNSLVFLLMILFSAHGKEGEQLGIEVATGQWTGVGAYVLVDAGLAQRRLDDYAASTLGAPQLYVPTKPIFSNIPEGKHVVYFDFGFLKASDLTGKYKFLPDSPLFWVNLPYLSTTPGGDPIYYISLTSFYTPTDEGLNECTTDIFTFQVADELTISESSFLLKRQGEEIELNFTVPHPCQETKPLYVEEVDAIVLKSSLVDACHIPNLHFCAPPPHTEEASSYCCLMEGIRDDVERYKPNVCTTYQSADERSCEASFTGARFTKGFRDVMLLGDEPTAIVASEMFHGNYTISLQYPCV